MKTFFSDKAKLVTDNKFVPATFDAYNNEYILTLPSGEGYQVVLQEEAVFETSPSFVFNNKPTQPANEVVTVVVPAPWSQAINASLVDGVATFTLDSPYRFKINSPSVTNYSGMNLSNAGSGGFTTTVESGVTYYNAGIGKLQITGVQTDQDFIKINIERNNGVSNNEITASIFKYVGTYDNYADNPVSHTGTVYQSITAGLHSSFGSKITASNGQIVIPITSTHPWTLYTDGNHIGTSAVENDILEFYQQDGATITNIPIADISVSNTAIGSIGFAAGAGNITVSGITENNDIVQFRAQRLVNASVNTSAESGVSSTGFTMNGNYISAGDGTATAKGFVYSSSSTNPDLTNGTDCVVSGTTTGVFSKVLTGLSNSTSYYYRAYVTNEIGTVYGATQTVTTFGASTTAPTVTSDSISTPSSTAIRLVGTVSSDGGATITERGVVVSTSDSTPTIGETGVTKVESIQSTSTFTTSIPNLSASTLHYVRAYATNVNGTSYGSVLQATTPATQGTITNFETNTSAVSYNGGTVYFEVERKSNSGAVSGTMVVKVLHGSNELESETFTVSISSTGTTQQFSINAPANVHPQARTLFLQLYSVSDMNFDGSIQ